MKKQILIWALAILAIGFLITATGRAQDEQPPDQPPAQQQDQQMPQASSTVGRLSVVQGQVSTMHGDGSGGAAATVNTPVVLGDKISTSERSRVEVQLDPANILRMDQKTDAQVADLQANKINIQLASGVVDYSALPGTQADVEIDTPNMGVHPLAPGVFRIQVNSDTETSLIVREGEAEVLTNDGSTKVEAGQMIQIHGSDHPEYKVDQASAGDDFDRWCSDRDRQMAKMRAEVPQPQAEQQQDQQQPYVGDSDLNAYGQWSEVPDEGWCWTPSVDAGWVPYASGHWGYMPYWGWTWISLEPWGWAPYHYGSWFSWGGHYYWRPNRAYSGFGVHSTFYGGGFRGGMAFSARGFVNGQLGGRPPAYIPRTGFAAGRANFGATAWRGYSRGPAATSFGANRSWQRYSSPSPYGGGRSAYGAGRSYYGGGYGGRYGGGSRPPLQLNRPIMQQRAPSYGGGYGGNRNYSAPAGNYGNRSGSAPAAGRSYGGASRPAPSGGGHSYSGGGGHASGGGGHGGGGHR